MSRKRKIALGILAALVLFCLWYTRPRSFADLVGEGGIKSISLVAQVTGVEDGKPFIDVWQVESYEGRSYVSSDVEEILRGCTYRVRLKSLLPSPSTSKIPGEAGAPIIHFAAATEGGSGFSAIYRGPAVMLSIGGRTVFAQAADEEIGEKLLAYAQEFGWETGDEESWEEGNGLSA